MKEFRVIVSVQVVNSDGEVVDHRGYPKMGEHKHTPLQASYIVDDYANVEFAQRQMNNVYRLSKELSSMMENVRNEDA